MYESFYGLKGPPFRLSPDPEFFFGSKGHAKALAYLRYGVTQKEGFVVITGAPGTGKTTLARALLKELGKEKVVVSEINTTHLESDDMLRLTAASFGLAHEGVSKSTLLRSLESFFIGRFRAGYHALLLVDESQNLPPVTIEELRMLSNFHLGNHPLVQIFLMGQEQFRDTLQSDRMEQLRQRVVASCHLAPLDAPETRDYIEHRLRVVDWKGDPSFTDAAFSRIFAITKGVPRRINTFCDRLLLYCSLESLHDITDETVNLVAGELVNEVSAYGLDTEETKGAESSLPPRAKVLSGEDVVPPELPDNVSVVADVAQVVSSEENADAAKAEPSVSTVASARVETVAASRATASSDSGVVSRWESNSSPGAMDDAQLNRVGELSSVAVEVDSPVPELETLVACFQYGLAPSKHARMADPKAPLPSGLTEVLQLAVGKLDISSYLLSERFSGAPIAAVRSAVRDYVKNVLLSGTADYYRRLGIPRDADVELAKRHYKYLFRLFQPDQERDPSQWNEIYARRINQAYATLRDPKKRASYDEFLTTYEKRGGPSGSRISDTMVSNVVDQSRPDQARDERPSATVDVKALPTLAAAAPTVATSSLPPVVAPPVPPQVFATPVVADREPPPVKRVAERLSDANGAQFSLPVAKTRLSRSKLLLWIGVAVLLIGVTSLVVKFNVFGRDVAMAVEQNVSVEVPVVDAGLASSESELGALATASPPVVDPMVSVENVVVATFDGNGGGSATERNTQDAAPISNDSEARAAAKEELAATRALEMESRTSKSTRAAQESRSEDSAPVERVASAERSSVSSVSLPERELRQALDALTLAYGAGDLTGFMSMFGPNASTNDRQDKSGIESDYKDLFTSTETRSMELQRLKWVRGATTASAKGEFRVSVVRKGASDAKVFSGSIDIDFERIDGQIKVVGFHHSYVTDATR